MDSGELIDLFYNRAYEKFVNKQILDDKNYIVPRQQLKNYVHELIDIPYIEFIDYLKNRNKKNIIKGTDVTHFSSFSSCEIDICNALIWANNPGCTFVEIGRLFPENVSSRNDIAYRLYGEKHVKAATQLGLTFEYYDYWYLSCIGYIYPDLKEDERKQLLARTITRNNLFQQMLVDIMDHDVYPEQYLTMYSGSTLKNRIKSVITFFDICIEECEFNNINTHRLYRRNANADSSSSLHNSRNNSIYRSFYSYKLLSFEDCITLFQRYKHWRDLNAFETLVKSYLRLVLSTAKLFVGKGLEYDDLIQEGTLGLLKAIEKYDFTKGFTFGFYAQTWIKQCITSAINTQSLTVKIPQNQLILYNKVRKEIEKYEQKYEFHPSITEIEIGDNIELENLSYLDSLPDDLHELVSRKDNWDDYPSNDSSADDIVMKESRLHFVNSLLKKLKHREADILRRVFGIGVKVETLEEIGELMFLTRERVRQIKEKAIKELREIVNMSNYNDLDDSENDEAKEIRSTIGEIESKKHINKMPERVGKSRRDSFENPQKESPKGIKNESGSKRQDIQEASVGDRIMYNSKTCIVLEIIKKYNVTRLRVRYDDGRIDNVLGEQKRYEILYRHGKADKKELSQPVQQERREEEDVLPQRKEDTTTTRKSREELYDHYTQLITRINQPIIHGKKILSKPALLVAVIDDISDKKIQRNRIRITTSLEERYNSLLAKYTGKSLFDRLTSIAMPFWHLQSDKFWFLASPFANAKNFNPSKKWLIDNVDYARLDDDLWYLLQDEAWRNKLRNFIIEKKLLDVSTSSDNSAQIKKSDRDSRREMTRQPKFLITTSLNDLVRYGIITNRQLNHCYKKGLRTIGDVKKKIEYYHLTPDSTRFTKYTLDMWFGIVGLLNKENELK